MQNNTVRHIIRYGISSEQKFLNSFSDSYDVLAINGNMLAHAPSALANFVSKKIVGKQFFIDPQTYAFQNAASFLRSRQTDKMKMSVKKMIEIYGAPLSSNDFKPLKPVDFNNDALMQEFCRRVVNFQETTIANAKETEEIQKYLDFANITFATKPCFLIAPYFYMGDSKWEEWLDLNVEFLKVSKSIHPDKNMWAQVVISKDILIEEKSRKKIIDLYSDAKPDGILLWVDEFSEHDADLHLLSAFRSFIELIKQQGISVINLYGGYFSILLTKFAGLDGVSHGLEYGESRAVVPVGGGIPMAKFYYPKLHKRLRYVDAASVLLEKSLFTKDVSEYYKEVCNCPMCKETIQKDANNFSLYGETREVYSKRKYSVITLNYPIPETRNRTLCHYLHRKRQEFNDVKSLSEMDLLKTLNDAIEDTQMEQSISPHDFNHLRRWYTVLSSPITT